MSDRIRIRVLDAVRAGRGEATKKSIENATGLACATVCKTVDSLLADRTIFARREAPSGRGRPALPLALNLDSALFAGLDLGGESWRILFSDLGFNRLYYRKIATPPYEGRETFFRHLFAFIRSSLAESRLNAAKLRLIGLAVSANTDPDTGVVVSAGNMGIRWGANLPVREEVEREFGVPACVITTQAAAAWAEYKFGTAAGTGDLVTVGLGVGIGAAIIAQHQLIVSRPDRPAGYIGHLYIPGNREICVCGYRGCLEAFAGARSLAAIARRRHENDPAYPLWQNAAAIDLAAAAGDRRAVALLNRAAACDAVGIAGLIQMYQPDALIFSGGQSRENGYLYNAVLRRLKRLVPEDRRRGMRISITSLGDAQSALGVIRLAYEKFF